MAQKVAFLYQQQRLEESASLIPALAAATKRRRRERRRYSERLMYDDLRAEKDEENEGSDKRWCHDIQGRSCKREGRKVSNSRTQRPGFEQECPDSIANGNA